MSVISRRYSIADARNRLPRLVHEAESRGPVELTRRGAPVAILTSIEDYQAGRSSRHRLWDAVMRFRKNATPADLKAISRAMEDVRSMDHGRDIDV